MNALEAIEWRVSDGLTPYPQALAEMERRAAAIRSGEEAELIWLVEHPPLFTAGTSAAAHEISNPLGLPVFAAGRGGRFTYHGPGQRVGYLLIDLGRRGRDIGRFVASLEQWLVETLGHLGVAAHRSPGRIGIWVGEGAAEVKIAAIGLRVRRWVTLHGFAINVAPDLGHFSGIIPCGIGELGVTSLEALGRPASLVEVDHALAAGLPGFLSRIGGDGA